MKEKKNEYKKSRNTNMLLICKERGQQEMKLEFFLMKQWQHKYSIKRIC
jgi:hypothetical protein